MKICHFVITKFTITEKVFDIFSKFKKGVTDWDLGVIISIFGADWTSLV